MQLRLGQPADQLTRQHRLAISPAGPDYHPKNRAAAELGGRLDLDAAAVGHIRRSGSDPGLQRGSKARTA